MSATPFTAAMESLTRVPGVHVAIVVSARDGVVIDGILRIGSDGTRVAALVASLYRRARRSADAAGLGDAGFLLLDAENGRLCAIGGDELLLVVVSDGQANIGVVRVELLRAAEALAP